MNVTYFGQYILEKGYINRDQLLEGIKYQKAVNLKIGVLAIDKNYMTSKQVETVLSMQKTYNKPFGELAISEGLLTKEKLEELLSSQHSDKIYLGEALLEKGFISLSQLEAYLNEYKNEQNIADKEINSAFNNINPKYSLIIKNTVQIFQNILLRLIDENGKIAGCFKNSEKLKPKDFMVSQKIFGEKNCIVGMAVTSKTLCYVASKILKREIQNVDAYAEDGLKEFTNIIVGHLCASLSNEGIVTETSPPFCVKYSDFRPDLVNPDQIIVPMLMAEDEFDIYFILN